ncbi:hypothetical protein VSDG_07279 [Cytospora chrysosperma]|uniref:ASST-domain-containing protein n=1 Tax=Cytospora chrysosperma TaxID=252740 RepID=A0A423VMU8_CYTCH|nr:hypothetical protein VSDG_07279 [Valsa sordida]
MLFHPDAVAIVHSGTTALSLRCTFDRVRKTNDGQAPEDSHSTTPRATPGYIFVSPAFSGQYRPDSGPYIFDTINGTLIWSGITATGAADHANVQGLHLCQYQDSPHLCFWRGQQRDAHGVGVGVIMSQNYTVVKTVSSSVSSPGSVDLHEFRLTPDNTAMITTYQLRFIDGLWVLDSCFEEVTVGSGAGEQALFRWCASDHISLDENPHRKDLSSTHKGKTPDRAWDYVHLNSIAKSPAGDYLISARHLDCIMLVSGVDGHILWRLGGGKSSNFTLDGDAHFARQHDARFVSGLGIGSGLTTISMFNNRNDGVNLRNHPSGGLILELDHARATARRVSDYGKITVPKSKTADGKAKEYISANGMGNLQTLPNGHVLANFGQHAAMAEYPPAGGDPMFYADFLPSSDSHSASPSLWKASNYRAFLYPLDTDGQSQWTGQPTTPPDLWTYARTPTSAQSFYVSWNGDTRTAQYRFWVSDNDDEPCRASSSPEPCTSNSNNFSQPPADEKFQHAGSWPRDRASFETNFTAQGTPHPWSFAEALDAAGVSLANSTKVRTYVPPEADRQACGELHCFPMHLRGEDLVPLDEFSTAMGFGSGEGAGKGVGRHWALGLLEHVFALVGLGMLELINGDYRYERLRAGPLQIYRE